MLLTNPACDRVAASTVKRGDDVIRTFEKRHNRDVETIASLVRVLREPKGRQIPLAQELKNLIRETLKEEI